VSRRSAFVVISLVLAFQAGNTSAQTDSASTTKIAVASLIPASLITAIVVFNHNAFWRYATDVPFHISNDPPYSMHIDKFSHFYVSAAGSDGMRAAYRWSGLSDVTSSWLGAGLSVAAGLAIELEDARHGNDPQYGFSSGDLAADIIGASLPVLRHYYPEMRRLDVKLSMWPSDAYRSHAYKSIVDDYESQYYWLSWDVHDITPLPAWLNVALGFGCENLYRQAYSTPNPAGLPRTDIYLAPDINLKGIPIEGSLWRAVSSVLSYIRIPLPALQCYPRVKFWWLR
jgi:hypothetical protein